MSKSQLPRADSTLLCLLVACSFITLWMVGAGWLQVTRIKELANLVIGLGIGTGLFSLARSFKDVSRDADRKTETVRSEMQTYYRRLFGELVSSGVVTAEQLASLETGQQIANDDADHS